MISFIKLAIFSISSTSMYPGISKVEAIKNGIAGLLETYSPNFLKFSLEKFTSIQYIGYLYYKKQLVYKIQCMLTNETLLKVNDEFFHFEII